MIHVPERHIGEVLLRADFRAFYAMELAWDAPLGVVLGGVLDSATALHRLAWCLASTWREARSDLTQDDFLDLLPVDLGELGSAMIAIIDEAISPAVPVDDAPQRPGPPERIRWTQIMFEGTHILRQTRADWWLSTFRVQGALLWELARYNDPDGKSGRPMAQWEIDEVNQRTLQRLRGMRLSSD
ncbi:MAG: hypothetical protein ACH37Z_15110 [Anaerolineae bacterium]